MADGEPSNPPAGEKENKEVTKEEEEPKVDDASPKETEDVKSEKVEQENKEPTEGEKEKEKEAKKEDTKEDTKEVKEEEKKNEKEEDKKEPEPEGEKKEEKENEAAETTAAKEDGDKKEAEKKEADKKDDKPTEVIPTEKQHGFKIGDWYCQSCGNHNFARRNQCMACQQYKMTHPVLAKNSYPGYPGPGRTPYGTRMPGKVGPREVGDWECPNCYNFNFARRTTCKWCFQSPNKFVRSPPFPFQYPSGPHGQSFPHPSQGYYGGYRQMGPYGGPGQSMYQWGPFDMMQQVPPQFQQYGSSGYNMYQYPQGANRQWAGSNDPQSEWDCWVCGNLNFAKRSKCKSCETEREKALPRSGGGVPRPGDWFCMSCQNVNFSKRHECKICNSPRSTSSNELVLQRLRGSGQVPF